MDKKIHLIGSEGFIGKALQRKKVGNDIINWSHQNKDFYFDLFDEKSWVNLFLSNPKLIIILSWPGLPNYADSFHTEINLPLMINFIEKLISNGVDKIVFAGTCYEYGLLNGKLKEDIIVEPTTQYGIAKNCLRQEITKLCEKNNVAWSWLRIFYPYGPHQNKNALLPSLMRAIERKDSYFKISSGNLIRDFIHVDKVAEHLLLLVKNRKIIGIFNSGSGKPQTILHKVELIKEKQNSTIEIITNFYNNRVHEPKEFWADMQKLNNVIKKIKNL